MLHKHRYFHKSIIMKDRHLTRLAKHNKNEYKINELTLNTLNKLNKQATKRHKNAGYLTTIH
jgi:hypothetical protein